MATTREVISSTINGLRVALIWLAMLASVVVIASVGILYMSDHDFLLPRSRIQTQTEIDLRQKAATGDPNAKRNLATLLADVRYWRTQVCHLKEVCPKFARIRQECAIAGSLKSCISAKMGDDEEWAAKFCTYDGEITLTDEDIPSIAECWIPQWWPM